MADDRNQAKLLFIGDYINSSEAWWLSAQSSIITPADLELSSLIVNAAPAGNILLTSVGGTNAPLIFQRPPADINAPSESLVMNLSPSVPTKPVDGEYITATKMSGTAYDDIAVEGLQIFGNQVIGSPAIAYITGNTTTGDVDMNINNGSFRVSSLFVSSLFADNVVSTTTGSANSYTASLYMSTPVLYTNNIVATNNIQASNISTNYISTNDGYATALSIRTASISTANVSSFVAGSFGASRIDVTLLSSLTGDITFSLVSTLSLFGNTSINPNINLGLGNVIQGLIGGAASQGLGVVLGGAALATGATALVLGRTSGGANPNVFQTVNGTTQLQFSTLGSPTTSVFFDTNSASPGTTPALETSTTITVPAGAYCVRSVSDPLYINNSVSSIQSFGQWVPVIQNNPTLPSFTLSTLTTSTVIAKSAEVSTLAVSTIGSTVRMSTILMTGNITAQNTTATLTWGSPGFQTVLSQTSTVMGNAWARSMNVTGDTFVQQVFGLSGNFNSLTGSNIINGSFLTGSNWVSTPALTTSSMTARGGAISSLTVSSVNGAAYPPPVPPDLFVSSLSATGTVVGATVQASGLLTSLNTFNANIINLQGNINTSNALATANFVTVNTSTINTLTANVSTVNLSSLTGNSATISSINVISVNGQPYPPTFSLPSSIFLSTANVNGNFLMTNPSATANFVTANTSTINALTANVSTINFSSLTGNSVISGGGSISTMNVSTLNGQPYPPPNFGLQLPSTIFLSTVNVNGNFAASNPSGSFGWPGAPGFPSTIIDQNGIQTPLITGLAGSYNALSLVGSNSILNLGVLGSGGGNVATPNPTSIAQFANISTNTLNASTIRLSGSFSGSSNFLDTFGWPGAGGVTPLPSTIIGYQGITTSRCLGLQGDFSTLNGATAAITSNLFLGAFGTGGNITTTNNPNAFARFANVTASTMAASTIVATWGATKIIGGPLGVDIDGIQTSSLVVYRPLPGGGVAFQRFDPNGVRAFGAEIFGNVKADSVSTINIEADFIKAKGDLIGSNNNTFSWGIGNARSYIVTSTIGVTPTGVAGFPNVNVGERLTVGQSALFTGGAQFANTITCTDGTFSGNLTTSNTLTANFVQANNTRAEQTGFINNLTANIGNITTNTVQNLFVNLVNGQPYPPQSGVTGATPSTMLASTVFVNGGLTNTGIAPIISPIANFSTLSSVRVQGLLTASTVVFNGGMTNTGGLPIITSNLSAVNINNVLFINGQVYPPPTGSTSIPSTLFASTVFVNGGQTITNAPLTFFDTALNRTNGNFIANSGTLQLAIPEVGSPGGSAFTITAGSTLASTIMFLAPTGRVRFTSSMTVRDPVPIGTPSQAYITTYTIGSEGPYGSVITSNVSTNTLQVNNTIIGGNVSTNSISTNTIGTASITANTMNATLMNTANINVSSVNGGPYPPISPPVGSIIIWAGGSDDGGTQNFNVPTGWLVCNGSEQDKLIYANLFGVIGQKYAMNKQLTGTNFYLPDLTFAVPMGTPFRNYASTINTPVQFQCSFETWKSDFVNPASTMMQTWLITQTIGGTLNYGTLFPGGGITQPSWPDVYVSQILSYDGNQGYVVVRSVNNSPIPSTIGGTTTARANGTVAQDASGNYLYTLGSYNANSAYPQVTRNQKQNEVYPHTHQYSQTTTSANVQNFTGTTIFSVNAAANVQTGFNTSNTISTVGIVNTGTYTAPNFLNMLYIIKY